MDFSSKLNALTTHTNETPRMGNLPSAPHIASQSAVETIKQAKASEFPVMPEKKKNSVKK